MSLCLIYKYRSSSGKVYVGQTWQTLQERSGYNGRSYKDCPYFYCAIQKYGWKNFTVEIVCYGMDQKDADFWEEFFIQKFDSRNPDKGYNIAKGGNRPPSRKGQKQTQSARDKMSIAKTGKKLPHTPEWNAKIGAANAISLLGKKASDATKAKMSTNRMGNKNNLGKNWKLINGVRVWSNKQ